MAYKTEELFEKAVEQIKKNRLMFIEHIVAYLPCSKSTFYEHFPIDSDGYKKMFEELERNRTQTTVSMMSKWYESESPALQMALVKITGSDEVRKRLSMQYIDANVDSTVVHQITGFRVISEEEEKQKNIDSGDNT